MARPPAGRTRTRSTETTPATPSAAASHLLGQALRRGVEERREGALRKPEARQWR